MIKPNYYITCYRAKVTDKTGYLFLQSKGRKNRKKKALGIAVNFDKFKDTWNVRDQKFKSGMENYKILNAKINEAIEEFTKEDGTEIKEIPRNKQSFLKFWDRQISLIPKIGSKVKHTTVKNKLINYLSTVGKNDLNFSDLTPDFVQDIHAYYTADKSLSIASVNSYMKLMNNICRRKAREDPSVFKVNPFATIKYESKKPSKRKVLHDDEVERLHTSTINDAELDFARDMFVFQLYSGGMRISDLCLLRWNNVITDIAEPKLDYTMYKTSKEFVIDTPITYYMCKALLRAIGNVGYFNATLWSQEINDLEREYVNLSIDNPSPKIDKEMQEITALLIIKKKELINELIKGTAHGIAQYIKVHNCLYGFVFPNLKSIDFENISKDDFQFRDIVSKTTDLHHKLLYGAKMYRSKLNDAMEICEITEATPHTARHTFTQLMINAGATPTAIKDALGHQTIISTDTYMKHKKFQYKKGENFINIIGNNTRHLGTNFDELDE